MRALVNKSAVTGAIRTAAALVCLHLLLSIFYWLPQPSASNLLAPTWDMLGLVVVIAAGVWARARLGLRLRGLAPGLTVLVLAYFVLGLGQGFARREFGYDVILPLHLPYVPELFRMMYNAEPLGMFLFYCAVLLASAALVIVAIHAAVRRLLRHAGATRAGLAGVVAATALHAAVLIPLAGINGPLTRQALYQIDMAMNLEERLDETGRRMQLETAWHKKRNPFLKLEAPPSILVFVVESYGQVLYSDRDFAHFRHFAGEYEDKLREDGYTIASRYVTAPVFGGSSWMTDVSLLCGVRVPDQRRFEALSTSGIRCLPSLLDQAGYRTLLVAPNLSRLDDKFAGPLSFEDVYYRGNLEYQGPRFTWSFMPDQYSVDFVHRKELQDPPGEPRFVTYVLTSSHHPWNKLPQYIDDWDSIGDGSIFRRLPPQRFRNRFVGGDQFKPAFMQSVEYSFQVVAEYLLRIPAENTLIVVLGDHQPRKPIADMHEDPWDVPIHVISRDPAMIERFAALGYTLGLEPTADAEPAGIESFLLHLFKAFAPQDAASF